MNQYENKCRPPVFGLVSGILLDKIKMAVLDNVHP